MDRKIIIQSLHGGRLKEKTYVNVEHHFCEYDKFLERVVGDFKKVVEKKRAGLLHNDELITSKKWSELVNIEEVRLELVDTKDQPKKKLGDTNQFAESPAEYTPPAIHDNDKCQICNKEIRGKRIICISDKSKNLCQRCWENKSNECDTQICLVIENVTSDEQLVEIVHAYEESLKEKIKLSNQACASEDTETDAQPTEGSILKDKYSNFDELTPDQQRVLKALDDMGLENCMEKMKNVPQYIEGDVVFQNIVDAILARYM